MLGALVSRPRLLASSNLPAQSGARGSADNLGLILACQLGQQGGNDKNIIYCGKTLP